MTTDTEHPYHCRRCGTHEAALQRVNTRADEFVCVDRDACDRTIEQAEIDNALGQMERGS